MMTPVGAAGAGARRRRSASWSSAMAWLTIPALLGPMIGPPLGGFITTYLLLALDLLDQRADRHRSASARRARFLPEVPRGTAPRPIDFRASCCRPSPPRARLRPVGGQPAGAAADRRRRGARIGARRRRRSMSATPAHAATAARPAAVPQSRLPRRRSSAARIFRDRHRRHAVPVAADVPARLRPDAVPVRPRSPSSPPIGAFAMKFLAPLRLRLGGFRNVLIVRRSLARRLHRRQRPVHARDPGGADHRRAAGRRLAALDLLHRHQCDGLRRYRGSDTSQATAIDAVASRSVSRSAWRSPAACWRASRC